MTFPIDNPALAEALAARGYATPTAVQLAVLQPEAEERDLLVSAQTGSGKTVAFGLALASTILGANPALPATLRPLVLVIAPTRELALQVHAELTWLYEKAGGRIVACVGGMDPRRESRQLAAGCHIVVGTPGRLQDHIDRGNLSLAELEAVVLDEADEMLDLGFKDELDFILSSAPESRRTLLFSATISREIAALARAYQHNALRIDTVSRSEPHADIEYRAILVPGHETEAALVNLLRAQDSRAIVFCATRDGVRHLHASLLARGFNAVALSGELSQAERTAALNALRDSRAQVCIATDVAARGLDLPDLGLVIHADLPTNKATLLHRSGRTGRAGRKGVCLLLVSPVKRRRAEMLLASANIEASWHNPPAPEEIRTLDGQRLLEHPLLSQTPDEERQRTALALLERFSPEAIAAAFISLAQAHLPEAAAVTILPLAPARPAKPAKAHPLAAVTGSSHGVWFRLPAGRKNNADPKWLIPLLCRRGGITKAEIGAIRIFDRETKFEIAAPAAESFYAAASQATPADLPIEPASPPSPSSGPGMPGGKPMGKPRTNPTRDHAGPPNEQQRRRQNKSAKGLK